MTSQYEILFWSHATTKPCIAPGRKGLLNKVLYREVPPRGPAPYPLKYCKIPKISPGAYIFQRPFLRGLFLEGPIFGRAYVPREICVIKSVGLACSWKEIYHFCFVLLCTWGQILSTSPLGGLYLEGCHLTEGFLRYNFGGAYFQNFTVPFWQKRYPFRLPYFDKIWYPFHIPSLELCIPFYYIDTDEIPGFFLLLKYHVFITGSEDTIFIFHVWGHWCRHGY